MVEVFVYGTLMRGGSRRLALLDVYEDVPDSIYCRTPILVADRRVAAYVLAHEHALGQPPILSGDWRLRRRRRPSARRRP